MSIQRPLSIRVVGIVALVLLSFAWAQTRVNGVVGACAAVAPADVVAESRSGLAWFPFEVGRGTVGADGAFALQFHDTLPLSAEVAAPIGLLFDEIGCVGLTISDTAARVIVVRDLRVIPRGAACEYCETLGALYAATQPRGRLSATGDLEVQWIHADRDVTVDGVCRHGWGDESYALRLEAGWNTVVLQTMAVRPSEGYCDCHDVAVTVAPFPRADVAWHFAPTR